MFGDVRFSHSNIRYPRQINLRAEAGVHRSWLDVLGDLTRVNLLFALASLGEASASELALLTHTSKQTLRRHLGAMVSLGLVHESRGESDGLTPGRPAARFSLDPVARRRVTALSRVLEKPIEASPR
jgi:DNA-binding transcriptional ArsR family regulator